MPTQLPVVGSRAPTFSLVGMDGKPVTLTSLKGTKVVLYFYPKDDTPGCTIEAKEFSEHVSAFKRANTVILGVSSDTVENHCAFRDKYGLAHQLLADPEKTVIKAYGCLIEKSMYGKPYLATQRATFVIDTTGNIATVFPNVTPEGHANDVLKAVKEAN